MTTQVGVPMLFRLVLLAARRFDSWSGDVAAARNGHIAFMQWRRGTPQLGASMMFA
jgi:hypothetical protein